MLILYWYVFIIFLFISMVKSLFSIIILNYLHKEFIMGMPSGMELFAIVAVVVLLF